MMIIIITVIPVMDEKGLMGDINGHVMQGTTLMHRIHGT